MTHQAVEAESAPAPRFSRVPLVGWRADLGWILLSAGAGWAYLGVVRAVGSGLESPLTDAFATLRLGDFELPLTLGLVVFGTWAVLLDAPHLFATLARTFLDPDEWRTRRGILLASLGFFLLGPAMILAPRVLVDAGALPARFAPIGGVAFLIFFRLWAYYHVVRQHWGFLRLYARRNPRAEDGLESRVDRLVFPILFYLPIGWYLTAPWYPETGMPEVGFGTRLAGRTLGEWLHLPLGTIWMLAAAGYGIFQWRRWSRGRPRNLPKLILLAGVAPLHAAAFSSPLAALFAVPIVTAGHNLQYHRFVWEYGQRRYRRTHRPPTTPAAFSFRSPVIYFGLGLAFTLLCYRGPAVAWLSEGLAGVLDSVVLPLAGLVAGPPESAGGSLGGQLIGASLLGWAMQHYYLDARIWRVSTDRRLRRVLDARGAASGR